MTTTTSGAFFQLIKVATCSLLTLQLLLYQFILAFRQPPSSSSLSPSSSPSTIHPQHQNNYLTDLWAMLLFIAVIALNGVALYAALVQQHQQQPTKTSKKALRRYLHLFLLAICPCSALVALLKVFIGAPHLRGLTIIALVSNLLAMPLLYALERLLRAAEKKVMVKTVKMEKEMMMVDMKQEKGVSKAVVIEKEVVEEGDGDENEGEEENEDCRPFRNDEKNFLVERAEQK